MMFLGMIYRMVGMAVVLAALSFVPSAAKAHSGHQHHAAHHAGVASIATASTHHQAVLSAAAEAKLDQDGDPASPERSCMGGCCSSAFGSCCPSGLPSASLL